jgi:hypothetical protein
MKNQIFIQGALHYHKIQSALVAKAERNPVFSARDLKAATGFPGQKDMIISRHKAAGLRARHAVVKELLTDEH